MADLALVDRRAEAASRLGFIQLATVRATGTFLANPSVVAHPVVAAVAPQLDSDPGSLVGYAKMPVPWKHRGDP